MRYEHRNTRTVEAGDEGRFDERRNIQHDWEDPCFFGNTEADARAKMLIYLIENKLISLGNNTRT